MTGSPFGHDPLLVVRGPARSGADDMALVQEHLSGLAGTGGSVLDIAEALPTAAFSRRDRLLAGYDDAAREVVRHGFAPITRPVGGHLAAYGEGSLVLHHWARHEEPRSGIRARFVLLGGAIADALRSLGVDARLGPVPGEYCDGEFSVNRGGRAKLVGTGQRIVRDGYLFSAVVMVHSVAPAREALTSAYEALGLGFDPATVGGVADAVPGVTVGEVREALVGALAAVLDPAGRPAPVGRPAPAGPVLVDAGVGA